MTPVDPDLLLARELAAGDASTIDADALLRGAADWSVAVKYRLDGIRAADKRAGRVS